ncbi:HAMP domain-containing sensor histidine kinase [Nocardioides sp. GY 10127]|uniref:sensor histidine kinase n=1 Tax=Nocardioides sp. GY 10127 TaxID=2569762 RepID=UPI0010A8466E|nr:HAMP domain-containing sensor histidine kinase [Nocardioides sp. GY 10127]TIC84084.1 HAMP domain-containing histidine kinase [Nocardioides sp. GY 10127]
MEQTNGNRTVAGTVNPALNRMLALVVVLVVIGVTTVVLSARDLDDLSGRFQPGVAANDAVLADVRAMDGAVSAWLTTGRESARTEFEQLETSLGGHLREVRALVADDPDLAVLVQAQQEAASAWLTQYARPRLAADGGPGTYRPARFARGQELLAAFERSHEAATSALGTSLQEAEAAATWRLRLAVGGVLLVAVLAVVVVVAARRSLLTRLSAPLLELESTLQTMATEPTVRARLAGPREVRSIARAVNELAEAQTRARAVESKIQSSLHTLDSARDDFVSNVSHELRTPLTTISGYLEMVEEEFEGRMAPRHERMLDATHRNVNRLKQLIDDLLTLSKAETVRSEREPSDLAALVRDAVTDVRITAAGRDIRISLDEPGHPVPVLADRALLGRALLNLVTNAVKFSHPASSVEVAVAAVVDDGWAAVTVVDRGIGIPEDEIERLGTRFFRARNAVENEIAGTGLGLRIVQTIIDRHDGDLRLSSVEGEGTTVVLRVPLLPGAVLPDSAQPAAVDEAPPSEETAEAEIETAGIEAAEATEIEAAEIQDVSHEVEDAEGEPDVEPVLPGTLDLGPGGLLHASSLVPADDPAHPRT